MAQYILRRLLGVFLSLWAAVTLAFLAIRLVPGDPAEAALSQSIASQDVLEQRRAALGLDLPLPVQYSRYLWGLVRGDLGVSWSGGQPVSLLIGQQIGATFSLACAGMAVALMLGVALGVVGAVGKGGWVSELSRIAVSLLLALPPMFSGILLIWLFAVYLGWFPATGQGNVRHLVLPALVVGLSVAGGIARAVDAGVGDALTQPFMRAVRAKGLMPLAALWKHALRVGLLPVLDVVALQFGFLLGGTMITESLFARQGLGRVMLSAVLNKDLPVVLGVVVLAAAVYGFLNLAADVVRAWLDPRIHFGT